MADGPKVPDVSRVGWAGTGLNDVIAGEQRTREAATGAVQRDNLESTVLDEYRCGAAVVTAAAAFAGTNQIEHLIRGLERPLPSAKRKRYVNKHLDNVKRDLRRGGDLSTESLQRLQDALLVAGSDRDDKDWGSNESL